MRQQCCTPLVCAAFSCIMCTWYISFIHLNSLTHSLTRSPTPAELHSNSQCYKLHLFLKIRVLQFQALYPLTKFIFVILAATTHIYTSYLQCVEKLMATFQTFEIENGFCLQLVTVSPSISLRDPLCLGHTTMTQIITTPSSTSQSEIPRGTQCTDSQNLLGFFC